MIVQPVGLTAALLSDAEHFRQLYHRGKAETDGMSFEAAVKHVRKRIAEIDAAHPDDDTFSLAYHAGFVAFQSDRS